jgi:hypothetical protein
MGSLPQEFRRYKERLGIIQIGSKTIGLELINSLQLHGINVLKQKSLIK